MTTEGAVAPDVSKLIEDVACFAVTYGLKHEITDQAAHALREYINSLLVCKERLDWIEWACHVDTEISPHFTVGHEQTIIWNQWTGLTRLAVGKTFGEALDMARLVREIKR